MFFLFTISCSQSNDVIANEEHSNPSIDRDGDGMSADEGDCDETNPWTFDGAPDIWYDGVDSDCEGNDDFDQDRDGFIPNQYVSLSQLPFGDCDDTNPLIHPDAVDESTNQIDENCDGIDGKDADSDGYTDALYGGTDCDDQNENIVEIWYEEVFTDEHLDNQIDAHQTSLKQFTPYGQLLLDRISMWEEELLVRNEEILYQYNIVDLLSSQIHYIDTDADNLWDIEISKVFEYDIHSRKISERIETNDGESNTIERYTWNYEDDMLLNFLIEIDIDGNRQHTEEHFWEYEQDLQLFHFVFLENTFERYEESTIYEYNEELLVFRLTTQKDNNIDGLIDNSSICDLEYATDTSQNSYMQWVRKDCSFFIGDQKNNFIQSTQLLNEEGDKIQENIDTFDGQDLWVSSTEQMWSYHPLFLDLVEESRKITYSEVATIPSTIALETFEFDDHQRPTQVFYYFDSDGDDLFEDYDSKSQSFEYSLCYE